MFEIVVFRDLLRNDLCEVLLVVVFRKSCCGERNRTEQERFSDSERQAERLEATRSKAESHAATGSKEDGQHDSFAEGWRARSTGGCSVFARARMRMPAGSRARAALSVRCRARASRAATG